MRELWKVTKIKVTNFKEDRINLRMTIKFMSLREVLIHIKDILVSTVIFQNKSHFKYPINLLLIESLNF